MSTFVDYYSLAENIDLLKVMVSCDLAPEGGLFHSMDYTNTVLMCDDLLKKVEESGSKLREIIEEQLDEVVQDKLHDAIMEYEANLNDEAKERFGKYLDYIFCQNGEKTLLKLIITFNPVSDIIKALEEYCPDIPRPMNQIGDFKVGLETQVNAIFEYSSSNLMEKMHVRFTERLMDCSEVIQNVVITELNKLYKKD